MPILNNAALRPSTSLGNVVCEETNPPFKNGKNYFHGALELWESQGDRTENRAEAAKRISDAWFYDKWNNELDLGELNLKSLPNCLIGINNLRRLNLAGNALNQLPDLREMADLQTMTMTSDAWRYLQRTQFLLPPNCQIVLNDTQQHSSDQNSSQQSARPVDRSRSGIDDTSAKPQASLLNRNIIHSNPSFGSNSNAVPASWGATRQAQLLAPTSVSNIGGKNLRDGRQGAFSFFRGDRAGFNRGSDAIRRAAKGIWRGLGFKKKTPVSAVTTLPSNDSDQPKSPETRSSRPPAVPLPQTSTTIPRDVQGDPATNSLKPDTAVGDESATQFGQGTPLPAVPVDSTASNPDVKSSDIENASIPARPSSVIVKPVHSNTIATRNDAQNAIISLVDKHLDDNPLEFFDAISKESVEVAAYVSVQLQRMLTPGEMVGRNVVFRASKHPDVNIKADGHGELLTGRGLQAKNKGDFPNAPREPCLQLFSHVVLKDLEIEIDRQNTLAAHRSLGGIADQHSRIFSLGIAEAINPENSTQDDIEPSVVLTIASIKQLWDESLLLPPDARAEKLALRSPHAAVFLTIIDQALRLKKSGDPLFRYEYGDEYTSVINSGRGETFLEGVELNLNGRSENDTTWRMRKNGEWQVPTSRDKILNHVFLEALAHLQLKKSREGQAMYPLVAYELLADAVGMGVPAYLKEHEQRILDTLRTNSVDRKSRDEKNREAKVANDFKKGDASRLLQADCDYYGVSTDAEVTFLAVSPEYDTGITTHSIDRTFPLASFSADVNKTRMALEDRLRLTHRKEDIAFRDTNWTQDNLCWLRSSWLSVLSSMEPEALEARLIELCPIDSTESNHPPLLRAIAQQYRANPTAFIRGVRADQASPSKGNGARLGSGEEISVDSVAGTISGGMRGLKHTTEGWLKKMQLEIAASFREELSLMDELIALKSPFAEPASSDLAVTLHRAFSLPVMVVESGGINIDGVAKEDLKIRVAAPKVAQAGLVEKMETASALSIDTDNAKRYGEQLSSIFDEFAHYPVLWMHNGHYDVYMPKSGLTSKE